MRRRDARIRGVMLERMQLAKLDGATAIEQLG